MLSSLLGPTGTICVLGLLTASCAARVATAPVAQSAIPVVAGAAIPADQAQPLPQPDPVVELIRVSTRHFETGQRELQLGHLEMAKAEFDRALQVLLESPFGGRAEPSIREHFDRLVERISAYEATALAQGDGFTERKFEPATIDDLLALSTFEIPAPSLETTQAVAADLEAIVHDIDIPLNAKVLQFVQLFTGGRMKGFLEEGLRNSVRF